MTVSATPNSTTFHQLGLSEPMLKAIEKVGYEVPTPIQPRAIPPLLASRGRRATVLVTPREQRLLREIERYIGQRLRPMKLPTKAAMARHGASRSSKIRCARRWQKAIWTCISPAWRSWQPRAS